MPKPAKQKPKPKTKPKEEEPEEEVDKASLNFLAIMGILGLILIVAGIAAVFLVSAFIGISLILLGILVYVIFYLMEKRLKVL
jgi:predicted membrane channel-forming protein YqfA (hemolysin III family)